MGMTEQSFSNAIEARELVISLRKRLGRMPYNPDLLRYCDNLGKMVSDLSSAEVEARRTRRIDKYEAQAKKLEKAVAYLQQLMLMHQLMS
jgi:hypothetical protein